SPSPARPVSADRHTLDRNQDATGPAHCLRSSRPHSADPPSVSPLPTRFSTDSSCPVTGVDPNIFVREIASPGHRLPVALMEVDAEVHRLLFHMGLHLLLVEGDGPALPDHRRLPDVQVDGLGSHTRVGVTDGAKNPSPVGVCPVNRRLDQVGTGYALGHPPGHVE